MKQPNVVLKIVLVMFAVCFGVSSARAHPHSWIELNTSFVLDEKARVVQIKQRWEFDLYFSLMTHADLLNEFGDEKTGLSKTAERMIKNLKDYDYFSKLELDGLDIPLGMPDKYRLFTKTKEKQTILELEMTFDIETDLKIENKILALQVFDPTYYIAMNYATESNIEIIGGNATACSKKLEFPEPSDELIDYAQNLDRTQKVPMV